MMCVTADPETRSLVFRARLMKSRRSLDNCSLSNAALAALVEHLQVFVSVQPYVLMISRAPIARMCCQVRLTRLTRSLSRGT
jgi:hypothetical protein